MPAGSRLGRVIVSFAVLGACTVAAAPAGRQALAAPATLAEHVQLAGRVNDSIRSLVSDDSRYLFYSRYVSPGLAAEAVRVEIATGAVHVLGPGETVCASGDGSSAIVLNADSLTEVDVESSSGDELPLDPAVAEQLVGGDRVYACAHDLSSVAFSTFDNGTGGRLYYFDQSTGRTVDLTTASEASSRVSYSLIRVRPDRRTAVVTIQRPGQGTRPYIVDLLKNTRSPLGDASSFLAALSSNGRFGAVRDAAGAIDYRDFDTNVSLPIRGTTASDGVRAFNGVVASAATDFGTKFLGCECRNFVVDALTGEQFNMPEGLFVESPSYGQVDLDSNFIVTPDSRWLLVTVPDDSAPGFEQWRRVPLRSTPLAAGGVLELEVAGRGGVPVDASAVVLNVTVTGPAGPGFVTVWPCGSGRPTASSLNYAGGETTPNAVISRIGADGKVCFFTLAGTHLIADVNGFFPAGSDFTAINPKRLLETRPGLSTVDGESNGGGALAAGGVLELEVAGRGGVPVDAPAVALNVTVTGPAGPGFVTVWPCGSGRPTASSLNYAGGETTPNAVISRIGADGKVCFFTLAGTHLIADVNGFFPAGSDFTAINPKRLLDTRVRIGM